MNPTNALSVISIYLCHAYMNSPTDKETATEIATRFLSQHFSVQVLDTALEGKIWIITARIEMFGKMMTEKIQIDSGTGRIQNYQLATS